LSVFRNVFGGGRWYWEYPYLVASVCEDGCVTTFQMTAPRTDSPPPAARRRRTELGEFLKARRARLQPEDLGLVAGPRRRAPGLRREEVALQAGVGVTWYTWLEQGRPINASAQVLDAVAATLRLDSEEREHLYRLAEATPRRSWTAGTVIPDSVIETLHALDPMPAVLVNSRFDVIESNTAHHAVFHDWHSMPCLHKNLLWCCVTEPTARARFVNYDEEVPFMVARLRSAFGQHVGDPDWEDDIRRLCAVSPEFAKLWGRHEVAMPAVRTRLFAHPHVGTLAFQVTDLEVAPLPDLRITVYTPADEETRSRLLAARECLDS
jgi:transcriptional regulator with XRE-family HTH domain